MADIQVSLELDDSKYTPKLDSTQKKTKEFTDSAEKGFKLNKESLDKLGEAAEAIKGKMESLGSAMVGVGLIEFVKGALEGAEAIVNMSEAAGVSIASMLEMQRAAAGVGKSAQDVANMMGKLEVSANNFAEGTGKARSAFGDLGITFDDLKSKSPDQIMSKAAHALAAMEDPAKRAAIATELFGKAGKTMNWVGFAEDLDKARGTQDAAAESMRAADEVMKNIKQTAIEVQNQFLIMAKPILEWIGPFQSGTEGAKLKAEALVGVIGLFAGGAAIVGINSVVNAIRGMAAAFGLTAGAGKAEAVALQENTAVTMESTASKIALAEAGYAAKVSSLELSIAEMQEAGNLQGAAIATRQLTTAKANLAMASGQAALAVKMGAVSEGEEAVAANGATVATGRLAGAMGALRTATVTFLGPIGAAIAAIGSLAAVGQAIWGKHGIANGGNGANFISDMLGITDSSGEDAAADLAKQTSKLETEAKEQQKKLEESMKQSGGILNKDTKLGFSDSESNAQKIAAIQAQNAAQKQNNLLSQEKINLEIAMVGESNEAKAAAMANFEAYAQGVKEIQRLDSEIAKEKLTKADKNKEGPSKVIAALEAQKKLVQEQTQAQMSLNEENAKTLANAQNLVKLQQAENDLKLKVNKDLSDMQQAQADALMSKEEKAKDAILKNATAEEESINKIKQAQLGSEQLSQEEKKKTHELVMGYYQQELEQQQKANAQAREFSTGWNESWKQWADDATNASLVGKQMFSTVIGDIDTSFKNLIHGRATDWKAMLDQMVTDLMTADLNRSIATGFGGGNTSGGGFWSGMASMFSGGHADGGTIPAGGFGVVGENGPEYVHGPATITPTSGINGASGGTSVNYTIHANDAQSFKQMLAQDPTFIYALTLKGQRGMPGGI